MGFDFDSPETQILRSSVAIAREALEKADALAIFVDTKGSDVGVAWLTFVDKQLNPIQEIGPQ
jgi:hypothetical protein